MFTHRHGACPTLGQAVSNRPMRVISRHVSAQRAWRWMRGAGLLPSSVRVAQFEEDLGGGEWVLEACKAGVGSARDEQVLGAQRDARLVAGSEVDFAGLQR